MISTKNIERSTSLLVAAGLSATLSFACDREPRRGPEAGPETQERSERDVPAPAQRQHPETAQPGDPGEVDERQPVRGDYDGSGPEDDARERGAEVREDAGPSDVERGAAPKPTDAEEAPDSSYGGHPMPPR